MPLRSYCGVADMLEEVTIFSKYRWERGKVVYMDFSQHCPLLIFLFASE